MGGRKEGRDGNMKQLPPPRQVEGRRNAGRDLGRCCSVPYSVKGQKAELKATAGPAGIGKMFFAWVHVQYENVRYSMRTYEIASGTV